MSKFVTRIAAAATLALAALPVVAVGAAHAETYSFKIAVADLDLAKPADVARYDARVDRAAFKLCSPLANDGLRAVVNCEKDVKSQASRRMKSHLAARMAAAEAPARVFAAAAN